MEILTAFWLNLKKILSTFWLNLKKKYLLPGAFWPANCTCFRGHFHIFPSLITFSIQ
uniref:Uncharacterized protein n=1 Tax=Arundo donax TaxID=35708 RepID=A0A0A9C8X4_ARUDO